MLQVTREVLDPTYPPAVLLSSLQHHISINQETGGGIIDNIYVYLAPIPGCVNEAVAPCLDGYTVWIDSSLDEAHRIRAYIHALEHIRRNDFSSALQSADDIELEAHHLKRK